MQFVYLKIHSLLCNSTDWLAMFVKHDSSTDLHIINTQTVDKLYNGIDLH